MRILVDTNVLARLVQPAHSHHACAGNAIENLRLRDAELCIVPQVLYELWVVCTRPEAQNGLGMNHSTAETELATIRRLFHFLRDERAIYAEWEKLVVRHAVIGKSGHDARLVAAMNRHGITHILTFNRPDFARYAEIVVVSPESAAPDAALN